jgi:hypothetical protein
MQLINGQIGQFSKEEIQIINKYMKKCLAFLAIKETISKLH